MRITCFYILGITDWIRFLNTLANCTDKVKLLFPRGLVTIFLKLDIWTYNLLSIMKHVSLNQKTLTALWKSVVYQILHWMQLLIVYYLNRRSKLQIHAPNLLWDTKCQQTLEQQQLARFRVFPSVRRDKRACNKSSRRRSKYIKHNQTAWGI